MEIGIDKLTIKVVPIRLKKRKRMITARIIPKYMVFFTSSTALLIKVPWLDTTVNL